MTHKITFKPHNREIEVADGESLIRAAMEAGVHINASCGGEGVCGKCRVLIEEGDIEGGISEHLSDEDQAKGYRLACRSKVKSDLVVRIPIESETDTSRLNLRTSARQTAKEGQFNIDQIKNEGLFIPPVEKIFLQLEPPSAENNIPDVVRIIQELRVNHDEHRLVTGLCLLRKIPDTLREDNFNVTVTIVRPVREDGRNQIIDIEPGDTTSRNFVVALDIGTTTLYGQLLDVNTGEAVAQLGDFNPQISYGEDVITRIVYADKEGGLEKLHEIVIGTINKILDKLIKKAGIKRDEITSVTFAGNSTMTQILLKINPKYIRLAPYVPASVLYPQFRASELGIDLGDHTTVLVYPGASSYVGGDIVSGIMGSGMYRSEKLTLFMDIGTNAEIVIGNKDWMACTAASAGPAFEGGGIKFGMRASKGAIEDFSIDPVTYEPMLITVGNVKAKGICGSGLITIAARLFETGVIDNAGKFNQGLDIERIRKTDNVWEYVLAFKEATQIDRDIAITESDIDNLIRAKGAMYSAAHTLLEEVGLTIDSIERIILAGGFGSYVDLESAMTIGLLPETDLDKVTYLGNGSLLGCKMNGLTNRLRKDVGEVVNMMTNFELAETNSYMDHYIASLFLPHTDLNAFPRLKKKLEVLKKK
ncbi:MAG: ASKHA domain-containing protein [Desulfobacteraceae bacterium]|nr:ASKHA domain-containing protein [Desulfobacteraceae bacterium]